MQAAVLLVLLLSAVVPAPAHAHAVLISSSPANNQVVNDAPAEIQLHFNEPVKVVRASARLTNDKSIDLVSSGGGADITLRLPSVGRGTVIASYRVVSEDGHPVGGTVVFHVGAVSQALADSSETPSVALDTAIWLIHVASIILLAHVVGGRLFCALFNPSDAGVQRPLFTAFAGFALLGSGLYLQGLDEIGSDLTFAGATPLSMAIRSNVAVAGGLFLVALILAALPPFRTRSFTLATAAIAIAVASAGFTFTGHSAVVTPAWLAKTCIFFHGGILLFWIGSLPPLWRLSRRPSRQMSLRSFSAAIPIPFVAMLLAGLTLAFLELPSLGSMLDSMYGRVLLVKIGLVALLCALAAYNRFWLTGAAIQGDISACGRLRISITAEIVLAVVIVGVASLWRFAGPDQLQYALLQPLSIHIHTEKAMAQFELEPKSHDTASVHVTILASDFGPMHPRAVTLRLWNPTAGVEAIRYELLNSGDGEWRAENVPYRSPNGWRVDVQVLIDDFTTAHLEAGLDDAVDIDGSASDTNRSQ
ncbi:copper-binding protein (plasmid) [Rhizobium grahamii]|uniref:Copper-binding protein n=1 Tax=Rhizobium grahamii TaxID=1120045 RepID=A0A5Q0CFL3_9HYPH|nr:MULTISPECIES: copper resistance protein CopC [Rhizobium]QFY62751.1 copper-binding protein [Rhizobium grahamii]QRM52504.1 copper-binding protein [Rhizobium sp. BG6]